LGNTNQDTTDWSEQRAFQAQISFLDQVIRDSSYDEQTLTDLDKAVLSAQIKDLEKTMEEKSWNSPNYTGD
jgi:hypothetical protein